MRPRMGIGSPLTLLLMLAWVLTIPRSAQAVSQAGAIVDTFSPGARGAALGHAGGLAPEGPFALRWNPAGVALDQPVSVGYTYNELATGFAEGISISHIGATGQTGAFGFGIGYSRITSEPQGTQTEDSNESALRFGGAIDIFDLFDADLGKNVIDFSIGAGAKWLDINLAPADVTQDLGSGGGAGEASSWTMDAGTLLRFGRLVDLGAGDSAGPSYLGLRASFVYDCLLQNNLEFAEVDQSDPLPSRIRYGVALEANLFPNESTGDLLRILLAYERMESQVENDDTAINGVGLEVAVANTLILRGGTVDDFEGNIVGGTYGVGLRLFPRAWRAGLQLDYANRPQAQGLDRVQMFTVAVGFDLLR